MLEIRHAGEGGLLDACTGIQRRDAPSALAPRPVMFFDPVQDDVTNPITAERIVRLRGGALKIAPVHMEPGGLGSAQAFLKGRFSPVRVPREPGRARWWELQICGTDPWEWKHLVDDEGRGPGEIMDMCRDPWKAGEALMELYRMRLALGRDLKGAIWLDCDRIWMAVASGGPLLRAPADRDGPLAGLAKVLGRGRALGKIRSRQDTCTVTFRDCPDGHNPAAPAEFPVSALPLFRVTEAPIIANTIVCARFLGYPESLAGTLPAVLWDEGGTVRGVAGKDLLRELDDRFPMPPAGGYPDELSRSGAGADAGKRAWDGRPAAGCRKSQPPVPGGKDAGWQNLFATYGEPSGEPEGAKEPSGEPLGQKEASGEPLGQKEASGDPQGPKEASWDLQGPKEASGDPQGPKETSWDLQGQKEPSGEPQGAKEPSGEPQGAKEASGETQGPKEPSGEPQGPKEPSGDPQGPKEASGDPQGNFGTAGAAEQETPDDLPQEAYRPDGAAAPVEAKVA
jgi:hypothetical protein